MRHTVVWMPEAEADLARCWLAAKSSTRAHLSRSVNHIDRSLAQHPEQKGAALRGLPGLRFYVAPRSRQQPHVGVVYEVSADDRLVRVLGLRVIEPQD